MNSKKRILFLGDINSVHLKKWVLELSQKYELAVFSFSPVDNNHWRIQYAEANVTLFTPNINKRSKLAYFLRLKLLKSAYKSFQPDIVHAHYATSYGFFGTLLKAKKYLVSVWGSDVFEFPRKSILHAALLKRVFSKATVLMSTSEVMAEEIKRYTNKDVHVTPFGIRMEKFVAKPNSKEKFIVGTVKTLAKVYGIDYLLNAFSKFHKCYPNSECHVYGRGPLEAELKSLAIKLNIEESVIFKGYVDHDTVPDVLNTFDVFCALSREESFGVAVLEASACELPVVVNNVSGLKEVVIDGVTGYVVDGTNDNLVAEKLMYLANNVREREKLGKQGRHHVEKNYSWKKSAQIMNEIYNVLE